MREEAEFDNDVPQANDDPAIKAAIDEVAEQMIEELEAKEEPAVEKKDSGSRFKDGAARGRAGRKRITHKSKGSTGVQIDSQTTIYSQVHSRDVSKWEDNNQ